jgi:hypothetical protein
MGCWDIFCSICGAPLNSNNEGCYKWLIDCIFLCMDGRVLKNMHEIACNISFREQNKKPDIKNEYLFYTGNSFDPFAKRNTGIAVHTDCWNYVKNKKKIELKFNNFPIKKDPHYSSPINIDKKYYGGIDKYYHQDFDYEGLYADNLHYMLISPLSKAQIPDRDKNRKRIDRIISKLELDKRYERPSPPTSASLYLENISLIGNDGNIWTVYNGKWKKDRPKLST